MKKMFMFLAVALLIAGNAFALQCKQGNYGSDECWTEVRVSPYETTVVTLGTVLVYDFNQDTADEAAFDVRVLSAASQAPYVAGVAQSTIPTGDRALILVRGQGQVMVSDSVTSADGLFPADNTDGRLSANVGDGTRDRAVAFALETGNGVTIDAFVTVV